MNLDQPNYGSEMKSRAGFNKIQTTLKDMHSALSKLQDKCSNEEEVLTALIKDFKSGGFIKIFDDVLGRDTRETSGSDTNKALPAIECHSENRSGVKYLFQPTGSSIMQITDVRLICDGSVLVKWLQPQVKSVIGYEICVDGTLKSKVRSATRTSAVIFNLNLENEITIEVYAVTPLGLHETPATAIFRPVIDSL